MLLVRNQSNRQILEDIQIQTSWPSCVLYKFWEGNCFATFWGESCEALFSSESILHSIFRGGSCEDISSSESILHSMFCFFFEPSMFCCCEENLVKINFPRREFYTNSCKIGASFTQDRRLEVQPFVHLVVDDKKNPCNFCRRDIIAGSWILVTNTQEFVKSVTLKLVIPFFVCL